ncbi:hypothetical protein BIW11_10231 [Tropilaelaps mercedesae]|uniref:Uncharacterized protein n=1 Tax=Tropilaelaps mercedesae TaxID=418985 RepID=A0A1V9XH22_9ACAR|nr:hypothetical protein BIW11_10231 [Tropilaelaps mercedesae]
MRQHLLKPPTCPSILPRALDVPAPPRIDISWEVTRSREAFVMRGICWCLRGKTNTDVRRRISDRRRRAARSGQAKRSPSPSYEHPLETQMPGLRELAPLCDGARPVARTVCYVKYWLRTKEALGREPSARPRADGPNSEWSGRTGDGQESKTLSEDGGTSQHFLPTTRVLLRDASGIIRYPNEKYDTGKFTITSRRHTDRVVFYIYELQVGTSVEIDNKQIVPTPGQKINVVIISKDSTVEVNFYGDAQARGSLFYRTINIGEFGENVIELLCQEEENTICYYSRINVTEQKKSQTEAPQRPVKNLLLTFPTRFMPEVGVKFRLCAR